jgi:hypothetical protein
VELRDSHGSDRAAIFGQSVMPVQRTFQRFVACAKAGLIGAAFSIALAIRDRTVALDTELVANVTDGTLRLLIGVISAGVLLLLFASGIVPSLRIGDADFKSDSLTWETVLVIGSSQVFWSGLSRISWKRRTLRATRPTRPAGLPRRLAEIVNTRCEVQR